MPGSDEGNSAALKRYAIQIATQLPEKREEAMRVLDFARELVEWKDERPAAPVFALRSA